MKIVRAALLAIASVTAFAQPEPPAEVERAIVHRHALTPPSASSGDALLQLLQTPDGFKVSLYASGLGHPRMIEAAADGNVYVTRRDEGDVLALRDTDGDGRADHRRIFLSGLDGVHGIAIHNGLMYLASQTKVWRTPLHGANPQPLIVGLPDGGQHPNRMIRVGPDGNLYVSVGSSCNDCAEDNQLERGTLIRYLPDGTGREVVANGLRNTIGYDWHPRTGALWGMDHGSDFRGDDTPPEELNRIEVGANYGWPICFGERQVDSMTNAKPEQMALKPGQAKPGGKPMTRQDYCDRTAAPALTVKAHSAPMALRFCAGCAFPASHQSDAFVALHGSWNRKEPAGYRVVRVRFDQGGQPKSVEPILWGFIRANDSVVYGRPVGIAFLPDGAMLVSDDLNGSIYRIDYVARQ
jgi:glucose/arabinose dehydrogenase